MTSATNTSNFFPASQMQTAATVAAFMVMMLLSGCTAGSVAQPPLLPDKAIASADTEQPTLADLWDGRARFVVDVHDTDLPMGESDTLLVAEDPIHETAGTTPQEAELTLRSYIHASYQSASVVDQCGDPVPFPGCVVVMESHDGGISFAPQLVKEGAPVCQFECRQCPCTSRTDQIDQQQYPQVVSLGTADNRRWTMVYEYRANVMVRRSDDGLTWTSAEETPLSGIWADWLMGCAEFEQIGAHPHTPSEYDCLVGSPPGLTLAYNEHGQPELYLFVGLGRNPGHMGCYRGAPDAPASTWRKCAANPLFRGAESYGPLEANGTAGNPYFDFRTISSADVIQVDDRFYMLFEGVRGPQAGDAGDTQFGLGMARSLTDQIDGPWETFSGNPLLVDLPANVGLGHADLIVVNGRTFLYTSLDGEVRSRLALVWDEQ